MKIADLNTEAIAQTLLRVPLVAMHAHHKYPKSTLKDYVVPSEDNLEAQFVKDVFTLTTDEIIEKWYDGQDEAASLLFAQKNK